MGKKQIPTVDRKQGFSQMVVLRTSKNSALGCVHPWRIYAIFASSNFNLEFSSTREWK